jgi:hypothetical protein
MASEAFIAAAAAANRTPVVLVAVESVTTNSQRITTTEDWAASKSIAADLTTSYAVGSVQIVGPFEDSFAAITASGPGNRFGAGMAASGGKLYLYGGMTSASTFADGGEVWEYDPATDTWTELTVTGSLPASMFRPLVFVSGGYLYVCGTSNLLNHAHLFKLNLSTLVWSEITTSSTLPGAMDLPPAVHNGYLYICHALGLYKVELSTGTVTQPTVTGTAPTVYGCPGIVYGDTLYVISSSPAKLDLTTYTWSSMTISGDASAVRHRYGSYAVNGKWLLMQGGETSGNGTGTAVATVFDAVAERSTPIDNGLALVCGAGAYTDDYFYIYGGAGSTNPTSTPPVDDFQVIKGGYPAGPLTIQTMTIDFGETFTQDSALTISDKIPSGSGLTYTARGSDNGTAWTDLGTVGDGSALDPYRYYDLTASFTSSGYATAVLEEIAIAAGDSQFVYYSTHRDTPVKGALPLVMEGLGTITSKIEPTKLPSVGETTINLVYCQPTFELLRDGYLRNKTVSIKVGFVGLAEPDYEDYFCGIWHDASIDHRRGQISVKVRSPLAKFAKVQLPAELAVNSSRSDTTVVPIDWVSTHAMAIALDTYDKMGIPDRFLDRASFTAAETTLGTDYNLTRALDKDAKSDAPKLLEQIGQITSTWFVPAANGKLTAIVYDPNASTVAELDARVVEFANIDLGMEMLYTRQHIYYTLIAGKSGTAAEHFSNGYVLINDIAEIAWGINKDVPDTDPDYRKNPGYSKEFFDLWNMSQAAREAMASQWDAWFSTPKMRTRANNVPPAYFHVQPGNLVGVTGLQLPTTGGTWGTLTAAKKFLVTGRTFDPQKCIINLDLLEV